MPYGGRSPDVRRPPTAKNPTTARVAGLPRRSVFRT